MHLSNAEITIGLALMTLTLMSLSLWHRSFLWGLKVDLLLEVTCDLILNSLSYLAYPPIAPFVGIDQPESYFFTSP